jgi:CBS domain-containing protein
MMAAPQTGERFMQLKDICTTGAVCCGRETTVLEAARLMRTSHAGDLVVVDDPSEDCLPVGMITDRDIVIKVLGNGVDPKTVTVGDVMHTPIVVGRESDDQWEAISRMRAHGVRRLPVTTSNGQLIGIVTLDDLLKVLATETSALLDAVSKEQDRERRSVR